MYGGVRGRELITPPYSIYSSDLFFKSPALSFNLPFVLSTLPSACFDLSSVNLPKASFASPFTLSTAPSTLSLNPSLMHIASFSCHSNRFPIPHRLKHIMTFARIH